MIAEYTAKGRRRPLRIVQDPHQGICEIDGTKYSYELLRGGFCAGVQDRWFQVVSGPQHTIRMAVLPGWLSWLCAKFARVR